MVKKSGVNLFAVIICTLVLLTGWGCTKKISTTDNVISEPGKGQHEIESKTVEELEYIQEASISDERGRITDDMPDSDSLVLKLKDIFFDFDKEVISSDSKLILVRNIQLLKENPDKKIIIEGHTDERGTNEYNLSLGERRARITKRYLVAKGIAPERISTITYGEERPFCSEQTEECFQLNRRAHFVPNNGVF